MAKRKAKKRSEAWERQREKRRQKVFAQRGFRIIFKNRKAQQGITTAASKAERALAELKKPKPNTKPVEGAETALKELIEEHQKLLDEFKKYTRSGIKAKGDLYYSPEKHVKSIIGILESKLQEIAQKKQEKGLK